MQQEPFFLVNDFLEKERKELEHVIEVIQGKDVKHAERATFLKNFTNGLFKAHRKIKLLNIGNKKLEKELLEKKKQELLKKLEEAEKNLKLNKISS